MADRRRRGIVNRSRRTLHAVIGDLYARQNRYRDVLLLIGLGLLLWAVIVAHDATRTAERSSRTAERSSRTAARSIRTAHQAIVRVQEGRATAITITCAVLSSVSQAGQAVIAGAPNPPPTQEERGLELLGFPPFKARHAQQQHAGALYVQAISKRVDVELAQLGHRPVKGLIRKDGTIDCRVLQEVSAVPNAR